MDNITLKFETEQAELHGILVENVYTDFRN